jgi:D-amino-acid dehydrogenase
MRPFIDRGLDVRVLRRDDCLALEPALAPLAASIAGAVLCEQDESGDCNLFTAGLAEACRAVGVAFRFDTTVRRLVTAGANRIDHIETDRGDIAGDACVVALGSYSPLLLSGLGIRLPIYPLKGYALTAPARTGAPAMSGVDEEGYVAWSRFGDRLRITSFAELGGYDTTIDPRRVAELSEKARALFPDGAEWEKAEPWCGLRPMTPTGMPIIGRSRIDNLWLNTGHGSLGWSMSCGSARVFADLFAERPAAVEFFPNSG